MVNRLQSRKCTVWWDQSIPAGAQYDREIERELSTATTVVVLWSVSSVDSEWVRSEASHAVKRGALLPISLDATTPPLEFSMRQHLDLTTGPELEKNIDSVLDLIANHVHEHQKLSMAMSSRVDWRTDGGFHPDDPLLCELPTIPDLRKSRYELCRELIDRRLAGNNQAGEAFEARARLVFDAFTSSSGSSEPDQRDAETALLLAHEIVQRYSEFGSRVREIKVNKGARAGGRTHEAAAIAAAPEVPIFFRRVYLNTVNTFLKDIIHIVANDPSRARQFGIHAREVNIAAATMAMIRAPRLDSAKVTDASYAGPEVHAAYTLGRLNGHTSVAEQLSALNSLEKKIDAKLLHLQDTDNDTSRRLRLMRRTSLLSQAVLGSPPALTRYITLLQNSAIESDANAGFHLEYYCDQPRDARLPLCSRDHGHECEHTVKRLCVSLGRTLADESRQQSNPLFLVEAYTLAGIVARRLHGPFDSHAREALPTIERVYAAVEDEDTKIYLGLLIDVASSSKNFAAQEFGRYMAAKNAPRNGWVKRGILFPETVGAHTASVLWLCRLLPRYEGSTANYSRVRRILEIHDLAEGITSDIVATNKKDNSAAERKERVLMRRFSWLGLYLQPRVDFVDSYMLYDEFVKQATLESQIARDLDRLDIVMQGHSLIRNHKQFDTPDIREMIERMEGEITTSEVKAILPSVRVMQVISEESFRTTPDSQVKTYYFPETCGTPSGAT